MGKSEVRNVHRPRLDHRSNHGQQPVSDIVERLRELGKAYNELPFDEAADEIERLQAEVDQLRRERQIPSPNEADLMERLTVMTDKYEYEAIERVKECGRLRAELDKERAAHAATIKKILDSVDTNMIGNAVRNELRHLERTRHW